MLGHMDQGTPGDGRKDGVRLRRDHLTVLGDEQEISAARLFHISPGARV